MELLNNWSVSFGKLAKCKNNKVLSLLPTPVSGSSDAPHQQVLINWLRPLSEFMMEERGLGMMVPAH